MICQPNIKQKASVGSSKAPFKAKDMAKDNFYRDDNAGAGRYIRLRLATRLTLAPHTSLPPLAGGWI